MESRYPILYQDDWLIAIDKPDGVLSHPNPGGRVQPCAFEGHYHIKERRFSNRAGSIWLIHRLDQDTSGILLAAKDADTARQCRKLFEDLKIQKTYLVLVQGKPSPPIGSWKDHLEKRVYRGMVRSVVCPGRSSNSELRYRAKSVAAALQGLSFDPLRERLDTHRLSRLKVSKLSLMEMTLLTGRTHQIRVQSAAHRHPIAGDRIYGDFALNRKLRQEIGLRRLFLHASQLEFRHPLTGDSLKLEAPLPEDLERVWKVILGLL